MRPMIMLDRVESGAFCSVGFSLQASGGIFDPWRLLPSQIFFVSHMLQPVGGPAVEFFLNCNMRHGRVGCGTVPMFFARREPDDVTRPNLLYRPTLALGQAAA